MTTYISILRGINVSGQKLIKMDALRKLYENLGFQHVNTYVQSGNVVFAADKSEPSQIEQKISRQIEITFGFEVPVIVLTPDKLRQIIDNNPFPKDTQKEPSHFHVTFLSTIPHYSEKETLESKAQNGEEIIFSENAIYLYCPNGYGRTKLTNNFIESKLKMPTTTRNWKTTLELLKMAQQIG